MRMEREGAELNGPTRPLRVLSCSDALGMGQLPRGKGKICLQIFPVPHSARVLPEDRQFRASSNPALGRAGPASRLHPGLEASVGTGRPRSASQTLGSGEGSALTPGAQTSAMASQTSSPNSLGGEARGQSGRALPAWQPRVG